jgi:hypothetical protein
MAEIAAIIAGLKSTDAKVRLEARRDLAKRHGRLSEKEGIVALGAAADTYPVGDGGEDISSSLVEAAWPTNPRPSYIPVVEKFFGRYSNRARLNALSMLVRSEQRAATEAYVRLVDKYGTELSGLPIKTKFEDSQDAELYLRLLPLLRHDHLASSIALMTLGLIETNSVPRDRLVDCAEDVLKCFGKRLELATPLQQHEGIGWMWEEDYRGLRDELGILLDLMGYILTDDVRKRLHHAMLLRDPLPRVFAIQSLLMHGERVDAKDVAEVAEFPEKRCLLLNVLKKFKRESLFPAKYSTQGMLAEGKMVHWLIFPTELGRAPDEIELMKRVTAETPEGPGDYFLFRFRTLGNHWAAKDGWMAGVAGPYLTQNQPTTSDGGHTFSIFAKWDSMTPDEHVEAIIGK